MLCVVSDPETHHEIHESFLVEGKDSRRVVTWPYLHFRKITLMCVAGLRQDQGNFT